MRQSPHHSCYTLFSLTLSVARHRLPTLFSLRDGYTRLCIPRMISSLTSTGQFIHLIRQVTGPDSKGGITLDVWHCRPVIVASCVARKEWIDQRNGLCYEIYKFENFCIQLFVCHHYSIPAFRRPTRPVERKFPELSLSSSSLDGCCCNGCCCCCSWDDVDGEGLEVDALSPLGSTSI